MIEDSGLTLNKDQPPVRCFTSVLDAGVSLQGYYRDGIVYINGDLAPDGPVAGPAMLSDSLLKVALEELVHFLTDADDNSRDFQDFLLGLSVKLGRRTGDDRCCDCVI